MKKQILIGLISLSSVLTMNAQIYTPNGVLQGASGNNNVGIGIINPVAKLDILNTGNGYHSFVPDTYYELAVFNTGSNNK